MSLKVSIDKVGRQSVTVEKDRKKSSKGGRRSRAHVDLRAVLSSKERSGREEQRDSRERERASTTGDLRDRLEKNRVQIDFEDFDPVMKGENCDISELGKQKLLSMFLDGNNPGKELKGKENEKSEDPSEIVKKAKKELEKTLSSEWGQRKKKKKKKSRSRSRPEKDRKPLVDKEAENRKRKHSPVKESKDVSKIKKEKVRSPSRDRDSKKKKKEKKNRKRSNSRENKDLKSSVSKEDRVSSKDEKSSPRAVSGRKSRIDSGISTGTNFSKDSVSISPRDERVLSPKKEPLVVSKTSTRKDGTRSPKRERASPRRDGSSRNEKLSPRKVRTSPKSDKKSPRRDKHNRSPKKEHKSEGRKSSHSPSPSPPRRVLERSVDDEREDKNDDKIKENKDIKKEKNEKNPYSVYEEKHGKRYDPKRRSREREPRRRKSKERDLKDEIDEMRRERMRARSRSREHRRPSEYDRYGRRPVGRSDRFSPRGTRAPSPSSWEDKVESFLQNTSTSTTLVEIVPSGLLPQEFDPSKPPPNLAAVVPPDYALTEYADPILTPTVPSQPIRLLTDVQTGQLIPQPNLAPVTTEASFPVTYQPPPTLPPPDYEQTVDITIAKEPQAMEQREHMHPIDEFAAMNALNQENEKTRKDNKPLTLKEKKKLEKSRKEIWQFVAKKLIGDPVFCNKVKKKKTKAVDDLKEKAEKCAVRLGLKLEKSGFSETRLWLMLKDNEKGILGFYDELSAAVINGTIETDVEARRPKDRLDSELLKDGTVFKYIGQYIQGNPTQGRSRSDSDLLSTGDLQSILQLVNTTTGEASTGPDSEQNTPEPEPVDPLAKREGESDWEYSLRSFSPFKAYLEVQSVPTEVSDAYIHTLVLSGFNYPILGQCVTNFQPPEPENPGEPPETVYGHLLGCLREISFEKYPKLLTENIDGHTVSIVRFVLDHFSKPKSPSPSPPRDTKKSSPIPPAEDSQAVTVPTGGNTTNQLTRKKYVTVSVSVDTIPVEGRLAVWQICLHTPGLPDEQDPDFEMMMVPGGVGEARLQEAGFMFNQEKGVWYHQGTEFGRRKAENEEKSVEKLVNYLEELRGGGRGAGLNNGLVLLFECAEDFGLVRSLLSGHSADIWSDTVRGVGCIDQYTRQADIPATYCPPYYKFCVGGEGKWLTTLNITTGGVQRQVKIEAETRAEMVYNILCDLLGSAPTYETFTKWYCYPSQSDTVATMAGNLELQRQLLPLQTHVDRQLFNARVQCVLEVLYLVIGNICSFKEFFVFVCKLVPIRRLKYFRTNSAFLEC